MPAYCLGLLALLGAALAPLPLATVIAGRLTGGIGARITALLAVWLLAHGTLVTGLGWARILDGTALLIGYGVLLLTGLALLGRRPDAARGVGAALATLARWRTWPLPERLLAAGVGAALIVAAFALPIVPCANWDTLMYQLPVVAEWLQHGSIHARPAQWWQSWDFDRGILFYPGAWNAQYGWTLALGGHERFAVLPNLVVWLLYGAAIRQLARQAGAAAAPATAAAALAMVLPIAAIAVHSAHNDLPLGALTLATLACAIEARRRSDPGWAALAIALAGLVAGTKQTGVYLAPLALLPLLAALAQRPRRRDLLARLPPRWPGLALALALFALLGVAWYVRNLIETGNPTGFVRMSLPGHELPGVIDAAYIRRTDLLHAFDLRRPDHWWLVVRVGLYYLGLPALLLLLPLLGVRRLWRERRPVLLAFAALAAVLAWTYLTGPWSGKHAFDPDLSWWMGQQLRYTFALWGVLAALAAAAAPAWRWLVPAQALGVAAAACALPYFGPMHEWKWTIPATGVVLILVLLPERLPRLRPLWTRVMLPLGIATWLVAPWLLREWRHGGWNAFLWNVPSALRRLDPEARPIAAALTHQAWVLYGADGRRPVRHLPLERCTSDDAIRAMLRDSGCTLLAVGETWPPMPRRVIDFLAAHPDEFPCVHGNPAEWGMDIFRIRSGD